MDIERFAGTETAVKSVGLVDSVKPVETITHSSVEGPVDSGGPVGKRVNIQRPLDAVRPVRLQGPVGEIAQPHA